MSATDTNIDAQLPSAAPASKNVIPVGGSVTSIVPRSLDDAFRLARALAGAGDMIPTIYQGKPDAIMAAILRGAEVGFPPMQALANIAVVNGRATIWGDGLKALVTRAGHRLETKIEGGQLVDLVATATLTRGDTGQVIERTFSYQDAKQAELLGKDTYKKYPKRMFLARATAWAIRDGASDALMGLAIREEEEDIEPRDVTPRDQRPNALAERVAARGPVIQHDESGTHVYEAEGDAEDDGDSGD